MSGRAPTARTTDRGADASHRRAGALACSDARPCGGPHRKTLLLQLCARIGYTPPLAPQR